MMTRANNGLLRWFRCIEREGLLIKFHTLHYMQDVEERESKEDKDLLTDQLCLRFALCVTAHIENACNNNDDDDNKDDDDDDDDNSNNQTITAAIN